MPFDTWDSYLYPGTNTLRNRFDELDPEVLHSKEYHRASLREFEIRNQDVPIERTYDAEHVRAIHRHLFQDVYEWAGEYRTVNMRKPGAQRGFADADTGEIDRYLTDAAHIVQRVDWAQLDRNGFGESIADVYAHVNQAHPFREGNGRSTKLFLEHVAEQSHFTLAYDRIPKGAWNRAAELSRPDINSYKVMPASVVPVFQYIAVERKPGAAPSKGGDDDVAPDIRAERMAAEERLFTARTREWKSATAAWKQRHPGVSVDGADARLRDLESELSAASTQAVRLEQTFATAADEQRTQAWGSDFQKVDAAREGVDGASVFRRRAAEEAHETARRDFVAKYGHEPTAEPPAQLRETWRRDAAAPGKDDALDASRRRAAEIRKQLDELRRDPAPQPPAKPKAGTPEHEVAKDARYQQRKAQRAQDRDRDQRRVTREPERRPAPKRRGPEL